VPWIEGNKVYHGNIEAFLLWGGGGYMVGRQPAA